MKVVTRKTAAGTEYWDTEAKQTLFVPAGKEAPFEVTENPKSMLGIEDKALVVGIDGKIINPDETTTATGFGSMTVPLLKDYAAKNDITIPKEVTKKDDIIAYIQDEEEKRKNQETPDE
jgi:hypothetical protein